MSNLFIDELLKDGLLEQLGGEIFEPQEVFFVIKFLA